jgi:hypothetical protein
MKKYKVTIKLKGKIKAEVFANSKEDAKKVAKDNIGGLLTVTTGTLDKTCKYKSDDDEYLSDLNYGLHLDSEIR